MKTWLVRIVLLLLALPVVAIAVSIRPDLPAAEVDARHRNAASKFVVLRDGARIHVRDEGTASGPPLVLVHGSNDSLHTWEGWVRNLGKDLRVISLDLPGHGLTGRVPGDDYSNEAFVRVLHEVVTALSLDQFVLAGNSMGGHVAWRYALQHPERIRQLILVDASGYPNDAPPPTWRKVLALPGASLLVRYLDPTSLVRSGLVQAVADPKVITEAAVQRSVDMIRREGTRDAIGIRQRLASAPTPFERIVELAMPTLILWGDRDQYVPVEHASRFKRDIRNSSLTVYRGIGHMPMREVPDRSAEDVRRFIARARAGR